MPALDQRETNELTIERVVTGGVGLARTGAGRVVLVDDVLPGEVVDVVIDPSQRTWRGQIVKIQEASPERVTPRCEYVDQGCGGCDMAYVSAEGLRAIKEEIVKDCLRRIGGLEGIKITRGPDLTSYGFRTTLRMGVSDGQPSFKKAGSNRLVPVHSCLVAHPALNEIIETSEFGGASEVLLRSGQDGAVAMIAVSAPRREQVEIVVPEDVEIDDLRNRSPKHRRWITETVHDIDWRVSAKSFFQTRPDGAKALADLVVAEAADLPEGASVVDLCAGVGLFAGVVAKARPDLKVTAVERSRAAIADGKASLEELDVNFVRASIASFTPSKCEMVIADPPKAGLKEQGVELVKKMAPSKVLLVSCDPASMARDVKCFHKAGYETVEVTLVDLFPHTHHVETVARLQQRPIPSGSTTDHI